jgi:hypothetical protein
LKIFQSKSNIEEEEEEEIQNMTGNGRCWHFFFLGGLRTLVDV